MMLAIPMVRDDHGERVCGGGRLFRGPFGRERCGYCWLDGVLTLIYTLAVGLSIGASAMVARRIGEQDYQGGTGRGTDSSPGSFHIGGFRRGRKHLRAGTAGLDGCIS